MPTTTQQRAVYNRRPDHPLSYDDRVDLFNPTIWLDEFSAFYQDAGTTPADAASEVVGQWTDRSGNGLHATASGSARPPLADVDGVLLPNLDGTNHYFEIANDAAWASLTRWTVLARVIVDTAGTGGNGYLWNMAGASDGHYLRFDGSLSALNLHVNGNGVVDGEFVTTSGVASTVEAWLWATYDRSETFSYPRLRNPVRFPGTAVHCKSEAPDGDLYIGVDGSITSFYDGYYRAFIVFPSTLSALNMRWIMNGLTE